MANALQEAIKKRTTQRVSRSLPEIKWSWATKLCPLCGAEVRLKFPVGMEPEQLDVLSHNVACDWCADAWQDKESAEDRILEIAGMIINNANLDMEKAREALTNQTRKFAEACRKLRRTSTTVWSNEFVELIVEKPEQVWRIIRKYEQGIAKE